MHACTYVRMTCQARGNAAHADKYLQMILSTSKINIARWIYSTYIIVLYCTRKYTTYHMLCTRAQLYQAKAGKHLRHAYLLTVTHPLWLWNVTQLCTTGGWREDSSRANLRELLYECL